MKYVILPEYYPHEGVDVYVVTSTGKKGVARYWHTIGKWLTGDEHLYVDDVIVKWKYADAVFDVSKYIN